MHEITEHGGQYKCASPDLLIAHRIKQTIDDTKLLQRIVDEMRINSSTKDNHF